MENPSSTLAAQTSLQVRPSPFRVLNGSVFFNGQCEACRPFCAAICCRGYKFVSLTEDEANSGNYAYKEASDTCDCETCRKMRELKIRYTLLKQPDGSCIYLDGARKCSIYENRPETCRRYSCVSIAFVLQPA
jgi:Fe-S-cluster containining protein